MRGGPAPSVYQGQGIVSHGKRRRPPRGVLHGASSRGRFSINRFHPKDQFRSSLDDQSARGELLGKARLLPPDRAPDALEFNSVSRSIR